VYARTSVPVTARGRLRQRRTGEPVGVAGVTVTPGDVVIADATGVAFVPRDRAAEVLKIATGVHEREQAIAADLRAGVPCRRPCTTPAWPVSSEEACRLICVSYGWTVSTPPRRGHRPGRPGTDRVPARVRVHKGGLHRRRASLLDDFTERIRQAAPPA